MKSRLLHLFTLLGMLASGALMAQPPNNDCWNAEVSMLTAGSSVVRTGNNEGATDQGLGVPQVWEAFMITECLDVTVGYCGTEPAFSSVHFTLYVGCVQGSGFANHVLHSGAGVNQTDCPDGNYTIPYFQLPPGTYYYLVESLPGSVGDYTITFTGTACTATPPVNDECAGAITLIPNETCITVTGDVDGANAGVSLPAITCAGWTGDASDDVWFQFEATATTHTILVMPSSQFDATVDLRAGTCGSTVNIDCSEIGGSGELEQINATGLTIGETYYVRVYNWWSGLALSTTFDICVLAPAGGDCQAFAGTLNGGGIQVCLENDEATLSATPAQDAVVPAGYSVLYLLTMGMDQVITDTSSVVEFMVEDPGQYTIHTLVYDETTLDLSMIVYGTTTGADVHALLVQGGGEICASLDLDGAIITVVECEPCEAYAGTLTPVIGNLCLTDGTITMEAIGNGDEVIPEDHQIIYILAQGTGMVIIEASVDAEFEVTMIGGYSIHAFVFDPATFNLNNIILGSTTISQLNAMTLPGGGTICAALDMAGATFAVNDCTPINDMCINAQGLNIYETGSCLGNETQGTTIFSTFSGIEPACDPSLDGYADVWYIFNSGENTQVFIDVNSISMTSWGIAVYTDCGAMSLIACEAEPAAPLIVNTTPDTDHRIMVYTNLQSGQTGEFTICLTAEVAVNFCLGGTVSTNMGEVDLLICMNEPTDDVTFVNAGVAAQNYTYILTDENDMIIATLDGNTMDFNDAPMGTYHVHGVSYNGMLTGDEEGLPIIGLGSTGDCISVSENHVTVNVDICTSAGSTNTSADWSLYPNPANGEINILYNGTSDLAWIQFTDMAGRIVADQQMQMNSGERHPIYVNEALAPGMYNVTLTTGESRSSMRLVVQ